MATDEHPIFTVDATSDPVLLRINGRASYLTSAPVSNLFNYLLDQGKTRIAVDFANCTGMDSTFLGLLAGAAVKIKRESKDGFLELHRLNTRNMELVRNLGLHRILSLAKEDGKILEVSGKEQTLESGAVEADSMLKAHESLVEADANNAVRFEDVISFLKKETQQDDS